MGVVIDLEERKKETPETRAYRRSKNHWKCRRGPNGQEIEDATPIFHTRRRPERKTLGHIVAQVADSLGQPLMGWQLDIVMVGLEYELTDTDQIRFFYDTIFYTLPRQSGKSYLGWCIAIARCMVTPASLIAWTAQNQSAASQKWKKEFFPLFEASKLDSRGTCYRTNGKEAVEFFDSRSSMVCAQSKEEKAHGPTLMALFMDEIWDVAIEVMDGADPSLSRDDSQNWLFSTAGIATSELYLTQQTAGRQAVELDSGEGVAYMEYSAFGLGAAYDDESRWGEYMPSLGYMTSYKLIRSKLRKARDRKKLNGFIRGYQNLTDVAGVERVVPEDSWESGANRWGSELNDGDRVAFGLDGTYERDRWIITVAVNGDKVGITNRGEFSSVLGVAERCNELTKEWGAYGAEVWVDAMGPAASVEGLDHRRVAAASEVNVASAALLDRVVQGTVSIRPDQRLDVAAEKATKRKSGDRWQWFRSIESTPLLSASLALYGCGIDPQRTETKAEGESVYDEEDFTLIEF